MGSSGSVTQWINDLRQGDAEAAAQIWRRYGARLLALARKRLGTTRKRVSDEEDVALAAFHSFCLGVKNDRFEKLSDRDDLWHLLVTITLRRSIDHVRRETRRRERGESAFLAAGHADSASPAFAQVPQSGPTPDVAALCLEQCNSLFESLEDETLRQIARWKMEGFTNDEIAEKLDCVTRTVERKLAIIRGKWQAA